MSRLSLVLLWPLAVCPQDPPSFARDIAPIIAARCAGCHAGGVKMGSLDLDTHESLMKGGTHGVVVVPGHSAESRLFLMITGKLAPIMPMDGTQLSAGHIAAIQKWIDAGANPPTPEEAARLREAGVAKAPSIQPKVALKPQIYSMAYHPRGLSIALGGFKEVRLADPRTGKIIHTLGPHADAVRALAFSRDGRWLAAGGGLPARRGEVKIWDVVERTSMVTIAGHDDCIYAVAFSPDGKWLATSSYDKLIKIWDPATGSELRTLTDHIDAVYALAFSPDGKRLVSGAADRTVKVWDPATGVRLYTLSEPLDGINTLALDPTGTKVAAGGMDKTIRIWSLGETGGRILDSLIAHEDAILKLAWSPDGRTLVSSAADRTLKMLRAADLGEVQVLSEQPDWAYGVDFSPDGKTLAVGRLDGSLTLLSETSFSLSSERLLP